MPHVARKQRVAGGLALEGRDEKRELVREAVSYVDDLGFAFEERFGHAGVEMRSAIFSNDLHAFLNREGGFVRARAAQGIKHIGDGRDPSFDGNVVPFQTEWITGAIPLFVVCHRDKRREL